jgi:exosortase
LNVLLPSFVNKPEIGPSIVRALVYLTPSALAMAWLISKAQWYWQNQPELNFGYGVPVLCLFLFSRAWESRPPMQIRWTWSGVILGVMGTGLLFGAQISQAAFGMLASILMLLALGSMLMVAANLSFLFGQKGARHFAFAFAFFFLALPIPSAVQGQLVASLQSLVVTLDVEVLKLMGIPARQMGSLIQLANGSVGINEACSGIRSLQAATMMSLFVAWLKLTHRGLQITLVALGILWAVFGNFLRSLFLSCVANAKGTEAVNSYHDAAGWYIMAFTFAGVALSAWLLRKLERCASAREKDWAGRESNGYETVRS